MKNEYPYDKINIDQQLKIQIEHQVGQPNNNFPRPLARTFLEGNTLAMG